MGTECQSLLNLRCQHDLVVGICQVNLGEAIAATLLPHQILWKWHGMTMWFQLLVHSDRVIPTDSKFSRLSGKAWFENRNHRCSIVVELGWKPHPSCNSRIIRLAEVLLDGKGNYPWFAEDGFCFRLELDCGSPVFHGGE